MEDSSNDLPLTPLPDAALCPFCGGSDTRLLSPFGGQLSVAQYWCRRCRTAFDYLRGRRREQRS